MNAPRKNPTYDVVLVNNPEGMTPSQVRDAMDPEKGRRANLVLALGPRGQVSVVKSRDRNASEVVVGHDEVRFSLDRPVVATAMRGSSDTLVLQGAS